MPKVYFGRKDEPGFDLELSDDLIAVRPRSGRSITRSAGPVPSRMFMGGVIVGDDMGVELGWALVIDQLEEGQPFLMTMAYRQAGDQLAFEIIERGEQGQRAVPHVIMGLGANMPDPQRQTGCVRSSAW